MNRFLIRLFSIGIIGYLSLVSARSQAPGLEWARALNGTGPGVAYPQAIITDASKNVYTVGSFRNTIDANPGAGTFLLTSAGQDDMFISKLDAAGNFVWALRIGGTGSDVAQAITVDVLGNVYITGSFTGTVDFDPGPGTLNLAGGGAFALSLDTSGLLNWAGRIGSGTGKAIAIDAADNLLIGGDFTGSSDFDPGAGTVTLTSAGSVDIFVSKFALAGTLIWVKQLGGTAADFCFGVDTDATNNVYTSGGFSGTADFNPGVAVNSLTSAGLSDIFISKLDAAGAYVFAVKIGGTGSESTNSLTVDGGGNVLITGDYAGTVDFDPGASVSNLTSTGSSDIFVTKVNSAGAHVWSRSVGGPFPDRPHHVITDAAGDVYMTGNFQGTADFDPGAGVFNLVAGTANQEAYVSKLTSAGDFSWALRTESTASGETEGMAVALDTSGDILIAGWFELIVDFDPGSCVYSLPSNGDDIFVMKLSPSSAGCIPPAITSFSPTNGPVGSTVVIDGVQFSPTASNNVVYFGAARANVSAATYTSLTVTVPTGATYESLTVTVNGFSASAPRPFHVTFSPSGPLNSCSFSAPTFFSSGNFGYGLATGDLDLDGKVDIVITNSSTGTVNIFRNTSALGILNASSFAASVDLPAGTSVQHVVLADVDDDGKLDIVAAGYDANLITIYRNIATPGSLSAASFESRVDLATGGRPFDVEVADLDGDGKSDIVSSTEGRLSFWRNIGTAGALSTGSFSARQDIFINSISVAVADLDVDGKSDLIIGPALSTVARVYRNISTPGTLAPASFDTPVDFTVGAWPDYVQTGDLDNDQRPEIITSSWPSGSISILKNVSSPGIINTTSFSPKVDLGGLTEPRGVAITDYDGDGFLDIAVALQISGGVNVYKNITSPGVINSGSFAAPVALPAGGNLRATTSADFDGDGKPDLAFTNWSGSPLSVIRNQVTAVPTITGLTPSSGIIGTQVTLSGTNFSAISAENEVKLNGIAVNVISSTTTSLTVVIPGTATTGTFTVTRNCNTATSGIFTVLPYTPPCNSVLLDGSIDKVLFPDEPSLENPAITVEAWVKVNAFTSAKTGGNTTHQFILFKRNVLTSFSEGFDLVLDESNKLFLAIVSSGAGGGGSQRILSSSSNSVNLGQWYHLAMTADNTTLSFYVNGELIGSAATGFPLNYGPEGLVIGNASPLNSWQGAFNGNVDEVRIWNFVRSQAQIQSTLTGALTGTETGLVAYYNMNESGGGTGITVTNSAVSTGAVNNGTTSGTSTTPQFVGTCSCVPSSQRDALIALYNATDGANWSDNTGWLSPDESTWIGITVTGCDITDITLPGNNLVGSIPPEIGNLTMLEGLDLGLNQLSGSIPPEIGNLTSLIGLNLSVNQLDGFLPPELGNLTSLEALLLSFNSLTGQPPIELENLLALVDASLNNNQFIGRPPLIGGNSIAMSTIELQFNGFTDLPDFTAYYSINLINVSNNRLTFDDVEPYVGISNFFYAPQALVPPGGYVVFTAGNTLSIPFSTGGTANSYQWYKNGVPIPGANSASFSLPGATAADAGTYEVQITNTIAPSLTLKSLPYVAIADPCTASTPTSGDNDNSFAPLISDPTSNFLGVGIQSTGKIITSTTYTIENSIIRSGTLRFNTDGSLDTGFPTNPYPGLILVQPDDKILIGSNDGTNAIPVRLNADGTPDATFNSNAPQYYSGGISALGYQPADGKVLVSSNAYMTPHFVDRLNADGTYSGTLPDANGLYVTTIAVQSNGYILLGGQFPGGIVRLDPSGIMDPTFAGYASDNVTDIVIQPDGKILVTGLFQYFNDVLHPGLVRLDSDGNIDNTFSAKGITDFVELGNYPSQVALLPDDRIVVAGIFNTVNGAGRKNLAVLNSDGTIDCNFDPGTSTDAEITGIAVQPDGKIMISGAFTGFDGATRYGLGRVNNTLATASCLPATERAALIALYNSTNGASWTNNTNWLSADESTWFGVVVSSCHVTNINLDNNLLAGPLPPELGDLNQLLTLQLSNNAITGSIPASLPNLGSLISLQLYNNQLTGSLPAGLYGMTTLQNLDLSNNQLTGSVSTSIGNLIGLTSLSLSINQFTGTLPSEIGNLTNLQYLRLALNQFSGTLPSSWGNLTALREFSVATNLLTGTIPNTLANLTNLNVLGLSFNSFSGDLPAGIGGIATLQQVSVRSNQFTSLPAFASTAITELRTENNRFHFGHLEPNAGKTGFTYSPQANLAGGSASTCEGTTLTIPFTTPGTANQYQWYKDGTLVPGATTSSFVKTTAGLADAGSYVVHVTNTLVPGLTLQSDPFVVTIQGAPTAPTVTGSSSCTPTSLTLSASGGSPGEYRWYAAATGGTDLGSGNDTFTTPLLSVTTTYHVAINNGTCESARTPVTAAIDAVAKPVIQTSNCTATGATLTGPAGFAVYAWSNGATTQVLPVTAAGTYSLVVTSAGGCVSPSSDPVTFTSAFCNQPPTLQPTPVTTTVEGTVTVNVSSMATDLDNNLDPSTLQVIVQPASGATAFINANFELVVDYSGVSFAGTDQLTIELCDVAGACVQEVITVEVAGEITVFNALSPNGDGKNDVFFIQYINALPETQQNKVTILNRWGTVVFETNNYDNSTNVFRGLSSGGDELPSGTYYYILEFSSGAAKRTGFISLRR